MKLNTTSQYAIRILSYIVQNKDIKLFKSKNISKKLNIPYKYLTKIMTQLSDANIVISLRGREGGFMLSKNPSKIKVIDILEAVKECLNGKNCLLGIGACSENKKCTLHDRWKIPKKSVRNMFQDTTLADL